VNGRLVIRQDILDAFPDLFGPKAVPSGAVDVADLIARLTRAVRDDIQAVLAERHAMQARVAARQAVYDFLPVAAVVTDPDGRSATVGEIRQGMIDGFLGRPVHGAWRVGLSVPIPADTVRPGLEGTGPCIDLGMAMAAINTGASSWMWDWEDAGGDYRDQLFRAWRNLKQLLGGEWNDGRIFEHPTKPELDAAGRPVPGTHRHYAIRLPSTQWPTIFHRVPGLHLRSRQMTLDGAPVPAMIPALVIHALNNYASQERRGSGIYFYIPKLEAWSEARIVGRLLRDLEAAMGLERGRIKIKMLNERAEFLLQQELIQWVLRENLIGPNVGRWDYINSREEMGRHDADMTIPNPTAVTMTEPSMTGYTRRNALMALLAGATPIGGMAAQMPNPRAPQNDVRALRDIWFDKLRERLTGLFVINGRLHDTYRQSWVATVSPAYVEAGREALVEPFESLQAVVDRTTPDERARLEALGVVRDGRISPLTLTEADLTPAALFSPEVRRALLARPQGPTTEDGMRYSMYMATEYMYQQLHGNNAAAIDDPNTGLRFMNDLATYEIFWHFLYLTVFHGVTLTDDGKYSKKGERITPGLFLTLLEERRATVKALFAKLGQDYASSDAELVLEILRRQIVDVRPDGTVVPQPRWIKYGSRVLLALIERTGPESHAILDAVVKDRADVAAAVDRAPAGEPRRLAQLALEAYDYVHDSTPLP
jgi:malate synthase